MSKDPEMPKDDRALHKEVKKENENMQSLAFRHLGSNTQLQLYFVWHYLLLPASLLSSAVDFVAVL